MLQCLSNYLFLRRRHSSFAQTCEFFVLLFRTYRTVLLQFYKQRYSTIGKSLVELHVCRVKSFFGFELANRAEWRLKIKDIRFSSVCAQIFMKFFTPPKLSFLLISKRQVRQISRTILLYLDEACRSFFKDIQIFEEAIQHGGGTMV